MKLARSGLGATNGESIRADCASLRMRSISLTESRVFNGTAITPSQAHA